MRINSRLIGESMRTSVEMYLRINQESIPDLFKNQQESLRINENQSLDLFENQWRELVRINENQCLDLFENQ